MKAVIPVAGLGTRMLPATKAIPKEMLPLVDKPLIQYIVNECVAAGIKEIVLVTHSSKNAIENHFDTSYELESTLEQRVKRQQLDEIRSICPPDVTIMHVRQGKALGLGHAVLCAKPMIGDDDFVVVLPDVILDEYTTDQTTENLAAMIARFNNSNASQILVEEVPKEEVSKYGIVALSDSTNPTKTNAIKQVVEKPAPETAPSNLAVVGRYVLSKRIWGLLEQTLVGAGGEIQLSDAIDALISLEPVEAYVMKGDSHDCGDKLGYAKAFFKYALRHHSIGSDFRTFLDQQ
ncbi:UTP--glucose-1-phosphate uridylyltransferase GalU [Vibrio owensii]|uniref:UTP--glucose-1-phosphate uridylyltransferase GalU n=1 Tax=Vibrio owensii TaxID=696485 RepID=UPI0018F1CCF8|nr:UTP--glucose-1-phosphate uridylyltransferase GalU [Vibrio owensii]